MKKNAFSILTLLLLAVSSIAWGGPRPHAYHWVVETAAHPEAYTVFRIYQHDHLLVYEETLPGKKLDIRKKKVRRQLDKGLGLYLSSVEQLAELKKQNLLKSIAFR